jgi:hypothetical protein
LETVGCKALTRATAGRPGKSGKDLPDSFNGLIDRLNLSKPTVIDAQRLACLPPDELEASPRLVARWRLGERLAKVERATGPGRGKKDSSYADSFIALIDRLKFAWRAARDAQRIACLPPDELEACLALAPAAAAALATSARCCSVSSPPVADGRAGVSADTEFVSFDTRKSRARRWAKWPAWRPGSPGKPEGRWAKWPTWRRGRPA